MVNEVTGNCEYKQLDSKSSILLNALINPNRVNDSVVYWMHFKRIALPMYGREGTSTCYHLEKIWSFRNSHPQLQHMHAIYVHIGTYGLGQGNLA